MKNIVLLATIICCAAMTYGQTEIDPKNSFYQNVLTCLA